MFGVKSVTVNPGSNMGEEECFVAMNDTEDTISHPLFFSNNIYTYTSPKIKLVKHQMWVDNGFCPITNNKKHGLSLIFKNEISGTSNSNPKHTPTT